LKIPDRTTSQADSSILNRLLTARDSLIDEGVLERGRGKGGSVRRVPAEEPVVIEDEEETSVALEEDEDGPVEIEEDEEETEDGFTLTHTEEAPATRKPTSGGRQKSRKGAKPTEDAQVISYRHLNKRVNNPEVGMVHPENDPDRPKTVWAYDPHIDPALQFDSGRAAIEKLIDDALDSGDLERMRDALTELKRLQSPYLNWTGKAEHTSFAVDTVSLHVHERIDPASILSAVRKRLKSGKETVERAVQLGLFEAPFETLPLRQAVDFYRHEKNWSNRLIAGDSLLVMNSLIQKESMAGQVQMIYIDPPYGIKYGSNFQPFTNKRDVKDGADSDLTQEPEMIKAFRDTWELGIHSYLTYLKDRIFLSHELLSESGSIFVQISDENVHFVRNIMDEIFGKENFCAQIIFRKTTGKASTLLDTTCDFIIWYAKNRDNVKYHSLYESRTPSDDYNLRFIELSNGARRNLTNEEALGVVDIPANSRVFRPNPITSARPPQENDVKLFKFQNKEFSPGQRTFSTDKSGLDRISKAGRLIASGNTLGFTRYLDDFPFKPSNDIWEDTRQSGFGDTKVYVVQTSMRAIERCLLMTTDSGDLVLDPTCGSGTTAFVAEKWGRRWITCDTSRVAVTLAKQRLMTASFDYYALRYPHEGLKGGFIYKTVPHVTLKSIANNPEIDEIYNRMHPVITAALATLNAGLKNTPPFTPDQGVRKGKKVTFAKGETLHEWEVPCDWPEEWPGAARPAFDVFRAARQAMQREMDRSISAHAEPETLYDQPEPERNKLRITGPFTVEAVPNPTVLALDETLPADEATVTVARSGETSRQTLWRDELIKTGIRGKGGQTLRFAELETVPGLRHLHAIGTFADSGERVVVSFGPEHAALEQRQVERALSEAETLRPAPKFIVFCAFTFDPEASKDIDEVKWPGVTLLKAQMNTDLLTEDLKKARSSNQSFWLMGQPDVDVRRRSDGLWEVEVNGFDYFDPKAGELISGGKNKIAMWSLDIDYDQRSLFPHQVFFPMADKKGGWNRLKKTIRAELDEGLLSQFHGTVSLPFAAGDNRRIAVKIVDDRGIESLKIVALDE
ncbi:site-specific DNA-methyltransferase, partial [Azospirillum griseum]